LSSTTTTTSTTTTSTTTTFTKGVQYGFFFDQSRCVSCGSCAVACKDWNDISPGPIKYLRVYQWESGSWPTPEVFVYLSRCNHCANPVCVSSCPNHAIYKEGDFGAVLIDPTACKGARQCWAACPYGAPTYASDKVDPTIQANMCHMCIDRLEQGMMPICVLACPQRALDFGPLSQLQKTYGTTSADLTGVPSSSTTSPSVVYKPHPPHKQIVPYDVNSALAVNALRPNGPALYSTSTDVTTIPAGLILRSKLVLKADNNDEMMHYSATVEG